MIYQVTVCVHHNFVDSQGLGGMMIFVVSSFAIMLFGQEEAVCWLNWFLIGYGACKLLLLQ